MSSLLFNKDDILLVNRRLATLIGLNEAIVLQQIHYWIKKRRSGIDHQGKRWIFNSLDGWREQFPFWSQDTVKRALAALKSRGILLVEKLHENGLNRTNYYTIDYKQIALLEAGELHPSISANCTNGEVQSAPMDQGKVPSTSVQSALMVGANCTDDYIDTKTSTETSTKTTLPAAAQPVPKISAEPVSETESALQLACRATWQAYRAAYVERYKTAPIRNAPTSSKIKAFVQRIGHEESPLVAAFYVEKVNEQFVLRKTHDVGTLLANAEGYRTQWATNSAITDSRAKQMDKTQTNLDTASAAAEIVLARRAAKAKQEGASA